MGEVVVCGAALRRDSLPLSLQLLLSARTAPCLYTARVLARQSAGVHRYLSDEELRQAVVEALSSVSFDGKRVLVLVPDGTRTMPMPLMFALFQLE